MAGFSAVYAVGESIAQFLRNTYPAELRAEHPCRFEVARSADFASADTFDDTVVTIYLYRLFLSQYLRPAADRPVRRSGPPPMPLDLHFMLDRIALTEVHEDPRRYRLRLVGSYWYQLTGFELTGKWTHEFASANQRKLTEDFYVALIDGRRPRFTQRDIIVDGQLLRYEIMLLPLSEDGSRISMIMTGIGLD